jgi:hypothetical protein
MSPARPMIPDVTRMVFRRSALHVLRPALPHEDVERVWARTRELQRELRKTRPRHSLGVTLVLRLFEWDRALYGALLESGVPSDDAGRWIADINWAILGPSTALNFSLSRVRSRDLRTRVQSVVDLLFAVVFTAPFRRIVHPARDEVAFDVTRCPLAEYFASQGTPRADAPRRVQPGLSDGGAVGSHAAAHPYDRGRPSAVRLPLPGPPARPADPSRHAAHHAARSAVQPGRALTGPRRPFSPRTRTPW